MAVWGHADDPYRVADYMLGYGPARRMDFDEEAVMDALAELAPGCRVMSIREGRSVQMRIVGLP